jgi:hypothetical protein
MTTFTPARCHFDRVKIFAPIVTQYVASLLGFKELAGHGAVLALRSEAERLGISYEQAFAELRKAGSKLPDSALSRRGPFEVLEPLTLSSVAYQSLPVDAEAMAREFLDNGSHYSSRVMPYAAGALVVLAYETAKSKGYTTQDPIWEFLRHCRNAVAHGNRFNVLGKEPVRPATWAGLDITRALQGTTLFQDEQNGQHFLKPADPVHLLWDIEQAYPSLAF